MIVARGLGRCATGATGIIAAIGFGLILVPTMGGGGAWRSSIAVPSQEFRKLLDDRDILEIVPIIVEVLNGRR